jgi:hypothetical protein
MPPFALSGICATAFANPNIKSLFSEDCFVLFSLLPWAIGEKSYSQRRACALVGLHPKTYRHRSKRASDDGLRKRLRELASQRRRFG